MEFHDNIKKNYPRDIKANISDYKSISEHIFYIMVMWKQNNQWTEEYRKWLCKGG